MSANYEIYRGVVAQAGAQYLVDVAAAETKRQATVATASNAAGYSLAQAGFPPDLLTQGGASDRAIALDAIRNAAAATKLADLFSAEERRQSAIAGAANLLRSQGELP